MQSAGKVTNARDAKLVLVHVWLVEKSAQKNRAILSYSVPKPGYKFFVQLTFDVTDFFFGEADSKSIEGGEGGRTGTLGLSGRKTFYSSSMYLIFPPTHGKPLIPLN